jgi:signal transduction histidine kinase
MQQFNDLFGKAAAYLEERADQLVEAWIEQIQSQVGTRTIQALPKRALRNHIPPVLHRLAVYIETPIEAVRNEMLGHLQLHAQIRLDQGYDLQELLSEFDALAQLVSSDVHDYVADVAEGDVAAALEISSRLATGLRAIGYVTVGLYRKAEESYSRDLAGRLAEFGRTIAHEVRSPLHTIQLGAELLETDAVAEDPRGRAKHAEVIKTAVKRMGDLLDNVDMLAVVEGARSGAVRSSLRSIVQAVLEEVGSAAQSRGVEISVDGEVPTLDVETVPVQLALANLLNNSLKYSDRAKSERWIRIEFEHIDQDKDTGGCRVKVCDNGIGIPEDLRARVLKRGFRAHPDVADGTGLGLAITRDVLTERGGTIELDSVEGKGTTVTFSFRALEANTGGLQGSKLAPADLLHRAVRTESGLDSPDPDGKDKAK